MRELDAGGEAPERRGTEEESCPSGDLPAAQPPRTGRHTTRSNTGTPKPAHTEPHWGRHTPADSQRDGDTPQADSYKHTTQEVLQKDPEGNPLHRDTYRRTHEETTGKITPTHTHTRIHTDTHTLPNARPSVHTPGRFEV